ncbi:hypothetical protein J7L68_08860, partial [bacterium]|nr:hypothetical protein [bacterium]
MKTIIFSIFLLLSSFCFGDWHSIDSYFNFGNGVSQKSVLDFRPHTQEFKSGIGKAIYMSKKLNRPSLIEDDLILGYINPDTVLTIEHDTTIYRNIALLNNAQLIVQNCTLNYRGDIFALDNSRLEFDNATLNLFQNYIYEFMIAALDSSRFIMTDCSIYSSNFPFGISAAMNGNIDFSNVDFDDAFATWSIMDDCSVTVNYADGAGEFVLIGDSSSLTI